MVVKHLLGRHAVVAGGTSGIGEATARALAREGAAVVACGRRGQPGPLGPLVGGEVTSCQLDVTDEVAVSARLAEVPELDLLVCAAGVGLFAPISRTEVDDLRRLLEINVVGTFLCARAALRRMSERRRGHIVIVGSIAAQRTFSDCGAYSASKAGQHALAKVLTEEARPSNVRVSLIAPGATDTAIWDGRPGFDREHMMSPDDVAGVIAAVVARGHLAIEELTVLPPAGAL